MFLEVIYITPYQAQIKITFRSQNLDLGTKIHAAFGGLHGTLQDLRQCHLCYSIILLIVLWNI
jgi:hypothetical protein